MARRFVRRPGALVLALGVGLAVVGLFGVVSGLTLAQDWPGRPTEPTFYVLDPPPDLVQIDGTIRVAISDAVTYVPGSAGLVRPPWELFAGVAGAAVIFGLLVAVGVTAARRGLYAPGTGRLVAVTGLLATGAGVAAILVTAFHHSPQWSDAAPFLVWVLIGCALLAIRDVLARAGALRSELDGVI